LVEVDIKRDKIEQNNAGKDKNSTSKSILLNWKKYFIWGYVIIFLFLVLTGSYFYYNYLNHTKELHNINVALKWIHQSQFAGNYVAVEKGFYQIHGLNVSLLPYNFKNSPIDLVSTNRATFGVASASEVMLARSKGIPVKAVAVIYQINPVCAFSLKTSGIVRPQDFVGKKIGVERGVNVEYEYIAMMDNLNINRSTLTEVGIGFTALELLEGTVDVSTGYVTNEPYFVIEKGFDVNIIMVEDYGINMYADVLFTTDDLINTDPNLVKDFVQATIDGWQYASENEDETIGIVMHYATDTTVSHEKYALKTSLSLINTGDIQVGYMSEEGWLNVKNVLKLQKVIVDLVNVSDCYDNQFVNSRDAWHKI
jgi:ABC-type nitrate/sulfonate/bicarbonate transport system substrate-binding protein